MCTREVDASYMNGIQTVAPAFNYDLFIFNLCFHVLEALLSLFVTQDLLSMSSIFVFQYERG